MMWQRMSAQWAADGCTRSFVAVVVVDRDNAYRVVDVVRTEVAEVRVWVE